MYSSSAQSLCPAFCSFKDITGSDYAGVCLRADKKNTLNCGGTTGPTGFRVPALVDHVTHFL